MLWSNKSAVRRWPSFIHVTSSSWGLTSEGITSPTCSRSCSGSSSQWPHSFPAQSQTVSGTGCSAPDPCWPAEPAAVLARRDCDRRGIKKTLWHYCFQKNLLFLILLFYCEHHLNANILGCRALCISFLVFSFLLFPLFCVSVTSCEGVFCPFFLCAAVSLHLGGLMMGRLKHLTFLNFHNCSAERRVWDTVAIKTPLKACFFFFFVSTLKARNYFRNNPF